MTRENKELLIKDLSCRIPYGVIVNVDGKYNARLESVNWYDEVSVDDSSNDLYTISEVRPYLFPLSSMTNEQKEKYYNLQEKVIYNSKELVNSNVMEYVNWCYKHHIDINGLIPIGLAIDCTNLNIY